MNSGRVTTLTATFAMGSNIWTPNLPPRGPSNERSCQSCGFQALELSLWVADLGPASMLDTARLWPPRCGTTLCQTENTVAWPVGADRST